MRRIVPGILFSLLLVACGDKDDGPRQPVDLDGDGYKDDLDCDDDNTAISPAAEEVCDDIDNNCDGVVDGEATDASTWYPDNDEDGYGSSLVPGQTSCEAPSGTVSYTTDNSDCDDADDLVSPNQIEDCEDGVDNDCDGASDGCTDYTGVDLGSADATMSGEAEGAGAGTAVAGAGDVDGDGLGDMLVGAPAAEVSGEATGKAYLVLGGRTGAVALSAADAKLSGITESDAAGTAVAGGDMDNDGYSDVLVGAPGESTNGAGAGAVYALLGPVSTGSLEDFDGVLLGTERGVAAGSSLAIAGDIDGDGGLDLIVGEPLFADSNAYGRAYIVLSAPSGSADLKRQDGRLQGSTAGGQLGASVAGAGDLDGDGLADIITGAPNLNSRAGAAFVALDDLRGGVLDTDADLTLTGVTASDYAGYSVASAGDQDGDGLDDLLIGAYGQDSAGTDAGAAYVVSGAERGSVGLGEAFARLDGDEEGDFAGYSVASGGDLDLDGVADLIIGAPRSSAGGEAAGVAYVVLGPVETHASLHEADGWIIGADATSQAARAVASAGDVDGDGASDVLVGTPLADGVGTDSGASWLVLGAHF